jgi:hypothetical protein
MNTKISDRMGIALSLGLALLIAAGGYFLLIGPKLSHANSVQNKADSVQFQNTVLSGRVDRLKEQHDQVGSIISALRAARGQLPILPYTDDFTNELAAEATAAHVSVQSIAVANPELATGAAPPAVTPTTSSSSSTASTAPGVVTITAVPGQLYAIQVTVISEGTGATQQAFLREIQQGSRAVLVNSVAIVPQGSATVASVSSATTMTVIMQIFVAPQTAAAAVQLNEELSQHGG